MGPGLGIELRKPVHETKCRSGGLSVRSVCNTWDARRIRCRDAGMQLIRRPGRAESSDDGMRFPWDEGVLHARDSMRKEARSLCG